MEFDSGDKPIVVKRVKKVVGGHHGGAWKVAFADFATAMMAFFLVLWLLEAASMEEKQAISGYFSDPTGFTEGGSPYVIDLGGALKDDQAAGDAPTETPETDNEAAPIVLTEDNLQDIAAEFESRKFQDLKKRLETRIEEDPNLSKYRDQIIMEVTKDGLQIQIVDAKSRPMFDSGSDYIKPYMNEILKALASTIESVPNPISISGHTDAEAFTERRDYSNWELSADRANAARRALIRNGVNDNKVAQVVGMSSSALYDRDDPTNSINRRISILVMSERSQKQLEQQQLHDESGLSKDKDFGVSPQPDTETAPEAKKSDPFEAFDRLRETMTRKRAEEKSEAPAEPSRDELF